MKNTLQLLAIVWIASAGWAARSGCMSDLRLAQKACCADGDATCKSTNISQLTDAAPAGGMGHSEEYVFVALHAAQTTADKAKNCGHPAAQCINSCGGSDSASKTNLALCESFKKSAQDLQKQSDAYAAAAKDGQKTEDASSDGSAKPAAMPSLPSSGSDNSSADNNNNNSTDPKQAAKPTDMTPPDSSICADGSPACSDAGSHPPQADAAGGDGSGSGASHNPGFVSGENGAASRAGGESGGLSSQAGGLTPASAQSLHTAGIPNSKGGGSGPSGGAGAAASPSAKTDASAKNSKDSKSKANVLGDAKGGGGSTDAAGAGGGGSSGSGNNHSPEDLSEYLPGGSRGPRSVASLGNQPAHPDIVSNRSNIFESITKRFQILCTLQELRDCKK